MPYRPTERTEARRIETRERIVAAARGLIAHGGFSEAHVAAVAERAGVATGTVYRHFDSKAELFAEVFRRVSQGEVDALTEAAHANGHRSASERAADGLEMFARRALRAKRLAFALIAEPVDPLIEAERLAYRRAYRDGLSDVIADGVASGELPQQNAQLTSAALVGGAAEALIGPLSPTAANHDPDAAPGREAEEAASVDDSLIGWLRDFTIRSVTGKEPAHVRS